MNGHVHYNLFLQKSVLRVDTIQRLLQESPGLCLIMGEGVLRGTTCRLFGIEKVVRQNIGV